MNSTSRVGLRLLLAAVLTGCFPAVAIALATDRDQPIDIEADSVVMDRKQQTAVYQGNVVLTQGSIRMTGDRLMLHFDAQNKLQRADLTGQPARFRQTPDDQGEDHRARAGKMEYYANSSRLNLLREAIVWQGKDTFRGEHIEYDTLHHVVRARQSATGGERVRITIQPRANKDQQADQP